MSGQALRSGFSPFALVLALCALGAFVGCGSQPFGKLTDALGVRPMVDDSRVIVDATIGVDSRSHEAYALTVDQAQRDAHIVGSFRASGGMGNDIRVFVMREDDYINWANGHATSALYSSGQLTTSSFDIGPLSPGRYRVVFDNTFSMLSRKNVYTQVALKYQRPR